MEHTKLTELLNKVAQGEVSVEKAALELKTEPFEDLGFAKLDHHRKIRQGAAEVIYGAGKTPEQILKITANHHTKVIVLRMRSVPAIDASAMKCLLDLVERARKKISLLYFPMSTNSLCT